MAETSRPLDTSFATTQEASKNPRRHIPWKPIVVYGILILGLVQAIFPFLWMLSASFMSVGEITLGAMLPSELRFGNYQQAWDQAAFGQYMWNSARITAITIIGQLVVCVPAAYAFARINFFGKNFIFGLILATLMIPEVATFIPNYLTVIWIGRLSDSLIGIPWFDNWPALTIPFMASAFTIFLLRQFFMQIPEDFWDAARIDGAGHLRYLISVVMPLSRAPVMTIVTFAFIGAWNALLWPIMVTQTQAWRPVAVGLTNFVSNEAPNQLHLQMAASVMMIIPILILYFFTQRHFTEGIASSGVKG